MPKLESSFIADSWAGLIRNGIGQSFFQISIQSKRQAQLERTIKHLNPKGSLADFTSTSEDERHGPDFIAREVLSSEDALTKHRDQILKIVFAELEQGRFAFCKRLANQRKLRSETITLLKNLAETPLPHPLAMKSREEELLEILFPDEWDRKEELLVANWDSSISPEWPPLCVWTDSAIDAWICEKLGIRAGGVQQIKDKRSKLGLIPMPFELVTSHSEGIAGLHLEVPIKLHRQRLTNILPQITINHLMGGAFELDEGAYRLQFLRGLKGFKPEVQKWMDEICLEPETLQNFEDFYQKALNMNTIEGVD